jgi:hypothetical protein
MFDARLKDRFNVRCRVNFFRRAEAIVAVCLRRLLDAGLLSAALKPAPAAATPAPSTLARRTRLARRCLLPDVM